MFTILRVSRVVLALSVLSSLAAPPPPAFAAGVECEVEFGVGSSPALGAMGWWLDYSAAGGIFVGDFSQVSCTNLVSGALAAFTDHDADRILEGAFVVEPAVSMPRTIVRCLYRGDLAPSAAGFDIAATDATDANMDMVDPVPLMNVTRISCLPYTGSTTTTTTTTTTTSTTMPGSQCTDWTVTFRLSASGSAISSLLFDVNYASAGGSFVGTGSTVSCTKQVLTALFAPNDVEATKTLTLGLVDLDGFSAPRDLVSCKFTGTAGDPPVPGDFVLGINASDNVDGNPTSSTLQALVASNCTGSCGDGVKSASEACDDGNTSNTDSCLNNCTLATCGDGVIRSGYEFCDDGNLSNNDACLNNCTLAKCGDGVVRTGYEACDDGNFLATDACLNDCTLARCGDGYLRAGAEACDDGNAVNADACLNTCVAATCGDGFVRTGFEACDDGNMLNTDACVGSCVSAKCGDGFVRAGVEACDDGNAVNSDACLNSCAFAKCGDGVIRTGVETCDDGNLSNTDACPGTCTAARCGDGFVRTDVETCDDGNVSNSDGCLSSCVAATCGDGYVRSGVEECDDANSLDQDGCSPVCLAGPLCSDPTGDGRVLVSDALRILQRGVGLVVECPDWTCDPNGDGRVTAPDSLLTLSASVGLPVVWKCPAPSAVVLSLVSTASLGGLQLDLDYGAVLADLTGDGSAVQCLGLVPGALYVFNDKPGRILSMSVVSLDGFAGPRDIARCKLVPTGIVKKSAFVPKIIDAISPSGDPVPGVTVKAIPY